MSHSVDSYSWATIARREHHLLASGSSGDLNV